MLEWPEKREVTVDGNVWGKSFSCVGVEKKLFVNMLWRKTQQELCIVWTCTVDVIDSIVLKDGDGERFTQNHPPEKRGKVELLHRSLNHH